MPSKSKTKTSINPTEATVVHMVFDGEKTKGWVHTHGLDKFDLPELEIRDIPVFMMTSAGRILNLVSDYLLNGDKPIKVGETMVFGDGAIVKFIEAEPIPGDEEHYQVERWQLVDPASTMLKCAACDGENGEHQH